MKSFWKQIAAAVKSSAIVTGEGTRRYINEHGRGEMTVSHQTENPHRHQQQPSLEIY